MFGVGVIGTLGLDRLGSAHFGGGGAFDPGSLFGDGEQGAWFDPSDLGTMFQDSAGTTPVTADGQPVGLILDKSGRNNHASQATAAKRPLYKTDGTLHWLQFDVVDDGLATAAFSMAPSQQAFAFFGSTINGSWLGIVFEISAVCSSNPGSINAYYNGDGTGGLTARQNFGDGPTGPSEVAVTPPNTSAYTVDYDLSRVGGDQAIFIRRNGAAYSNGGNNGSLVQHLGNYPLFIGARDQTSLFLNGRIYSLIVLGRLATTQEITDTETWVAGKTGVTLP